MLSVSRAFLVIAPTLILLAGCVSTPIADRYDAEKHAFLDHVVVADSRGKFDHHLLPSGHPCLDEDNEAWGRNEIQECQLERIENGIAKHIASSDDPHVLIFIHGGLNRPHDALDRVAKQYKDLIDFGYHPIFLNWRTDGLNAYGDQIVNIRQGERVEQGAFALITAQRAATPIFLATDIAESVVTAPLSWTNQGTRLVSRLFDEFEPGDRIYRGQRWDEITHKNNLIVGPSDESRINDLFEVGRFMITAPFKIVTTPFVDTIGETAWNNMRRSSRAVYRPHLDFSRKHVPANCPEKPTCHTGQGAFAEFFERLDDLAPDELYALEKGVPPERKYDLSIVAHSMGTIVANDAVRDFKLRYDNLVYLAAASSIRHFYNTVVPMLEAQHEGDAERKTRFYNLMLHPQAERHEQNFWGVLPRGSLLEWIDSMYEESDSTFDRTLGNWNNVERIRPMLSAGAQTQMVFKVFPLKDGVPTKHGEFGRQFGEGENVTYNYWDPQFWGSDELAKSAE